MWLPEQDLHDDWTSWHAEGDGENFQDPISGWKTTDSQWLLKEMKPMIGYPISDASPKYMYHMSNTVPVCIPVHVCMHLVCVRDRERRWIQGVEEKNWSRERKGWRWCKYSVSMYYIIKISQFQCLEGRGRHISMSSRPAWAYKASRLALTTK